MDEGTSNQPLRAGTDLPTKGIQSKMEGGDALELSAAPKRHRTDPDRPWKAKNHWEAMRGYHSL